MFFRAWVVVAMLLGAGCIGTPQPNPPNVSLDGDKVEGFGTRGDEICIEGGPGAVTPAHSTVRIFSLDRSDPPVDALSDAVGSFGADVPGLMGEEYRLQVWFDGYRSQPQDIQVWLNSTVPAPRPLAHCLAADPPLELEVSDGGSRDVTITNNCGEPVTVERAELRAPSAAFVVRGPATPAAVPDGGSITVTVEHNRTGPVVEEILMIELSSPQRDRRPITLFGL